ncbi:MAG: hypothetical protein JSR17_10835 [Proteobacteria bacterium]|nr:hypothetical protein [Pseudomonadota bacterium]
MKKVHIAGLMLCIVALSGCQHMRHTKEEYLRNRSQDYVNSRVIAPVRVPEGLSPIQESVAYPLPTDLPPIGSLKPVSLLPPGFGTL